MLDWLKRDPRQAHVVQLGERALPLEIRRLAHARRLTLRLAPDGSAVRISMPRWATTRQALDFADSRIDWLERQLATLAAPTPPGPGATVPWRGASLVVVHHSSGLRGVRQSETALSVGGPVESLGPRLRRWMQAEARVLFLADLAHYAPRAGVSPPPLALTNARSRWGSCSSNGTVRLNWRLAMAPDPVRRSVVAHEVAHLVHFDHSPRFHGLLGELYEGDIAAANAWLKRHGRGLYGYFG